jgi:hypothetical protein
MMRIIETLLLRGKLQRSFYYRKTFFYDRKTNSDSDLQPHRGSQPGDDSLGGDNPRLSSQRNILRQGRLIHNI